MEATFREDFLGVKEPKLIQSPPSKSPPSLANDIQSIDMQSIDKQSIPKKPTKNLGESSRKFEELLQLRLDAAVPDSVCLDRAFVLAVAVRQLLSPILNEEDLSKVKSGDVQVSWPESQPYVRLRVRVRAPDCAIHAQDSHSFRLYFEQDSPVFYFQLVPKKQGEIGIVITIFQEDDWLGSARVQTVASEQVVGTVQVKIESLEMEIPMLTPEQQAAWRILQQAFALVAYELKQRWQFAREKTKASDTTQQPNVSQSLQDALKSRLEDLHDSAQLTMRIDDLKTAIVMAEKYNRRRNGYRRELPTAADSVLIEMQIDEAQSKRDKAITEIKTIFEELTQEEVVIEDNPD